LKQLSRRLQETHNDILCLLDLKASCKEILRHVMESYSNIMLRKTLAKLSKQHKLTTDSSRTISQRIENNIHVIVASQLGSMYNHDFIKISQVRDNISIHILILILILILICLSSI
jgi:hypothetical protein